MDARRTTTIVETAIVLWKLEIQSRRWEEHPHPGQASFLSCPSLLAHMLVWYDLASAMDFYPIIIWISTSAMGNCSIGFWFDRSVALKWKHEATWMQLSSLCFFYACFTSSCRVSTKLYDVSRIYMNMICFRDRTKSDAVMIPWCILSCLEVLYVFILCPGIHKVETSRIKVTRLVFENDSPITNWAWFSFLICERRWKFQCFAATASNQCEKIWHYNKKIYWRPRQRGNLTESSRECLT